MNTQSFEYNRVDFDTMAQELEQVEVEIISNEHSYKILRMQIDQGLENTMRELQELKDRLPKEQSEKLFDQCTQNALNAITGHFGLAAVVLDSQDGGNVHTTHNARNNIYASDTERERYEQRGEYDSSTYHKDDAYKNINKQQGEFKEQGGAIDYMTGKKIKPNDQTDLDHKVAAKTIHDDKARVLAEVDGKTLANIESNLALTDSSLNRIKKAKTADEFIEYKHKELDRLKTKAQRVELSDKEKAKIQKLESIDDKKLKEDYDKAKKDIDKAVDKAYYGSAKPYKEALVTGSKDAAKMAAYSAIGMILRDFVKGMMIELKVLFKEFGNESLKEIFMRFKSRLEKIWSELKVKWKDIIAGSFEAGIVAFFSNLIVFVVNIVFTTMKKFVQIIRAGFTSLYQAIKIIANPPKDMTKDEVMTEAAKVFVAGVISAVAMLGSEAIKTWLMTIPGLNVILAIPIPLLNETIGDALSLCISAAVGAVFSTIAIYYIDKYASQSKEDRLQIQIMTKSGEIVQYKIAQTYFVLHDAWNYFGRAVEESWRIVQNTKEEIVQGGKMSDESAKRRREAMKELMAFQYEQDMKEIRK